MKDTQDLKNIERRTKELAKEYENKGYRVLLNPSRSQLPDFLSDFEPDLIAINANESVVVEVKSRQDKGEFDKYEILAERIAKQDKWRFELVMTNTLSPFIEKNSHQTLDVEEIKKRLIDLQTIINIGHFDAAYLLCWSTLEAAMRLQLKDEKQETFGKPSSFVIKTLFSLGLINQNHYKRLDELNLKRNNLIHGFHQLIDRASIDEMVSIITYLIGESVESIMQDWLESLDLDNYDDIHSLYLTVNERENYGLFEYKEVNNQIIISADHIDDELILESDVQRTQFAKLIEDEYMDGMSPDGWYAFHRAMEKDD